MDTVLDELTYESFKKSFLNDIPKWYFTLNYKTGDNISPSEVYQWTHYLIIKYGFNYYIHMDKLETELEENLFFQCHKNYFGDGNINRLNYLGLEEVERWIKKGYLNESQDRTTVILSFKVLFAMFQEKLK